MTYPCLKRTLTGFVQGRQHKGLQTVVYTLLILAGLTVVSVLAYPYFYIPTKSYDVASLSEVGDPICTKLSGIGFPTVGKIRVSTGGARQQELMLTGNVDISSLSKLLHLRQLAIVSNSSMVITPSEHIIPFPDEFAENKPFALKQDTVLNWKLTENKKAGVVAVNLITGRFLITTFNRD